MPLLAMQSLDLPVLQLCLLYLRAKELKHFGDRVGRDRWIEQAQELAESKAG